jgi:hypothetical protein
MDAIESGGTDEEARYVIETEKTIKPLTTEALKTQRKT